MMKQKRLRRTSAEPKSNKEPTPFMMGGKIANESRRVRRSANVPFDQTRSAALLLTIIYARDDGGPEYYRGAILSGAVTTNGRRLEPMQVTSFLHKNDRTRVAAARASLAGHARIGQVNWEAAGVRQLLYGFIRQNKGEGSHWVTGMLDLIAHQLGAYRSAMDVTYPSRDEFEQVKQRIRTKDEQVLEQYKQFRARTLKRLAPMMGGEVAQGLRRRRAKQEAREPEAAKVVTPPERQPDDTQLPGMNRPAVQAIMTFLRQKGAATIREIGESIERAGFVTKQASVIDEVRYTIERHPHLVEPADPTDTNRPRKYKLTDAAAEVENRKTHIPNARPAAKRAQQSS
jgi:hypothetical protein